MMDKIWWIGMIIIFLVIFPTVAIIVLAILFAIIMAGGSSL